MSSEKKRVTLKSTDDVLFTVEEAVALESKIIANILDGNSSNAPIPLPNVTGTVLAKVIEYCQKHVEAGISHVSPAPMLTAWDVDFVKKLDHDDLLFDLILAANYLDIKGLLDLTCESVADMLKGMSVEDIRKKFNIKNDYTPEEEEEVRRENAWAFV